MAVDLKKNLNALIIGVSHYDHGFSPLPGVLKDVPAVEATLTQAGFTVHKVIDPESTRQGILSKLDEFIRDYGENPQARLLIYYAGHGYTNNDQGFIVPKDAPSPDINLEAFLHAAINMDTFVEAARKIKAIHVIFLFDSCFSGALFQSMRGTPRLPPLINKLVSDPVRLFITAGTDEQQVPDNSIFRHYFATGLSGGADLDRDGYITGTELGQFIRSGVANESRGNQTPLFSKLNRDNFAKGDFIFLSKIGNANPIIEQREEEKFEIPKQDQDESRHRIGEIFKDCQEVYCPRLVIVPPGQFQRGSPNTEEGRHPSEGPTTTVAISYPLAVGQFEVTLEEWDACFKDGGCGKWVDDEGWGREGRPVINVNWHDTQQFLAWLTLKTGKVYRLLTEAEWEYVARGGMTMSRPWGESLGHGQANCRGCGSHWDADRTSPIGSFAPNRFGLYDMIGNVWEWVQDCYQANYQAIPVNGQAYQTEECYERVLRGGSFDTTAKGVRSAARGHYPDRVATNNLGFRVVREKPF